MKRSSSATVVITSRILIGIVTLLNLQAAILFLIHPENFVTAFDLAGIAGETMIRGVGLLFVMWNVPYIAALIHPVRNFVSLLEAVIMQAIGVLGESAILWTLKGALPRTQESVIRFIYFDGAGLVLLIAALFLIWRYYPKKTI